MQQLEILYLQEILTLHQIRQLKILQQQFQWRFHHSICLKIFRLQVQDYLTIRKFQYTESDCIPYHPIYQILKSVPALKSDNPLKNTSKQIPEHILPEILLSSTYLSLQSVYLQARFQKWKTIHNKKEKCLTYMCKYE